MTIIPVIDLLHGQVVRAVRGDRKTYQPIRSALCASSEPIRVARTLSNHCAATQFYVADLDALQGGSVQVDVLQALLDALPDIELWVDGGFADPAAVAALQHRLGRLAARIVPVYASESLRSREGLAQCFGAADDSARRNAILSLDRRDGQRLDAAGCWELPAQWPRRVIVMTLERVGADAGPDLQTLAEVRSRATPGTRLIGAGGIRDAADIDTASAAGADAWLVASALHDLRLPPVSTMPPGRPRPS